jgi:hypothetical protein
MIKHLGTFRLGHEPVKLCADIDADGSSWLIDGDCKELGKITIAFDQGNTEWERIMEDLMHETIEYAFSRMGLRFEDSMATAKDTQMFVFMMTHLEFLEAVARATQFVVRAQPHLLKLYRLVKKETKPKKSKNQKKGKKKK